MPERKPQDIGVGYEREKGDKCKFCTGDGNSDYHSLGHVLHLGKKVSELYISSPILPDLHKHILCVYTSYSFSSMPILCLSSPSDYEIFGGS